MLCPVCEHAGLHTYDSRKVLEGVLRKRKCLDCDFRFFTFERPMSEDEYDDLQLRLKEQHYDTRSQGETEREEAA